ncbi:MAG: FAD-dependent oxidoreductase [Dehalococcoidales bacterium]|nr:FAD-dependent oxidoreductase [Dehalococcoidales bacterium]
MKTIEIAARQVPVAREADVLVVGGGPAGIGAAIAAARSGARTILAERYGFLGGTATAALVGPFMTDHSLDGSTQVVRGIYDELMRRMEAMGGALHPAKTDSGTVYSSYIVTGHKHVGPFHPEALKSVAAEMCLEAGVELLLHSWFLEPVMEGQQVAGAVFASKSGQQAVLAKVSIDCTGDADLAYQAGAPTVKGRETDGKMQPMTMFFRIGNVNRDKVEAYHQQHSDEPRLFQAIVDEARARGEFPVPRLAIGAYMEQDGWSWRINTTRLLGLDGTKVEDLITGEIEGRRQVAFLMDFFHKHLPGFENCVLLETGAQVGVRETRRILGEHVLSLEDLASGEVYVDTIALGGFPVDIHQVDGAGGTVSGWARGKHPVADAYAIPYRSLVPREVEGLLVAGRCLSATHEAAGAVRVMPTCFAMGQAAGMAAALALRQGVEVRQVDVSTLRQHLQAQGAYVGPVAVVATPVPPTARS